MLLSLVVVMVESWFGFPPQIGRFLAGFMMLVLGLGFAELALIFGAAASLTHHLRPWLDSTIYENLFNAGKPLRCRGTRNRLRWLLPLGMLLVSLTFLPSPAVALILLVKLGNPLAIPGGIVFTIFWYFTFRALHTAFANLAKSPGECWHAVE